MMRKVLNIRCSPACWVLAAILLAGCVNQEKETGKYRGVLDERVTTTAPAYEPGNALSLDQALVLANEDNEQLALRGEEYLQALIDKDRSVAAFLPQVALNPTFFRQEKVTTGGIAGLLAPSIPFRTFDLPLAVQMNLFNGFRDVAALRAAGATADARRDALLDLQQGLLLEVAQVYYRVLIAEHQVVVLKNTVKVQEDRVNDMRARQKVGLARMLDVNQTEAQASGNRVVLIRAQTEVRNSRTMLAFLIGQPAVESALADQFKPPAALPALPALQTIALENRSDFRATLAQVQAAQQNLYSAMGQYAPTVNFSFNEYFARQSIPKDVDWNFLFNGRIPIFTGGLIENNIRTAWSVLRSAKLNESLVRRQIAEQVAVAWEDLHASERRLTELTVELKAAEEAFRQADESYKVGLATNLERLIAQDRLLTSQLQLTAEEFNRKIYYLNLLRTIGRFAVPPSAAGFAPTTTTCPAK